MVSLSRNGGDAFVLSLGSTGNEVNLALVTQLETAIRSAKLQFPQQPTPPTNT